MRTNLLISLVLLALTIAAGVLEEKETLRLSRQYVSAAKELRVLMEDADWDKAEETVTAYREKWQREVSWLQVLINHEDIDDVTLALERLHALIDAREQGAGYEVCAELEENARHIYHRDALTLGNVL